MTDQAHALVLISSLPIPEREHAFTAFQDRWKEDHLVIDTWFAAQAQSSLPDALDRVRALTAHPLFSYAMPNKVRALIGNFALQNPLQFNRPDGSGYAFVADQVLEAIRAHQPKRRVVLVLRPRGCGFVTGYYDERLPGALAAADLVLLADLPSHLRVLAFNQRGVAAAARRRGVLVKTAKELNDFLPRLGAWLRPGDVVVVSVFHLDHAFPEALCSALASLPAAG